jgi:hypothetical protein
MGPCPEVASSNPAPGTKLLKDKAQTRRMWKEAPVAQRLEMRWLKQQPCIRSKESCRSRVQIPLGAPFKPTEKRSSVRVKV